jgi:Spy/CpxP family protein refolding chaperone
MKLTPTLLLICAPLALFATLCQAQPRPDPLMEVMTTPQLLMQHADDIGLDEGQKEFVHSQFQQLQEKYQDLQQNVQREMAALGELLRQEHPDEQKAIAQLDKVLDGERGIKRLQLSLALALRGKLTAEQQGRLREVQQKMMADAQRHGPGQQPPESLRTKMQQMQELVKKSQEQGKDLDAVRPLMEQMQPLMREAKFKEAEELLDRALKTLQESDKK